MQVSANLLSPGLKIRVGKNAYELLEVKQELGLTRVIYKTAKGVMRSKTYRSNDSVKIV